ncbi:hypothetical protein [Pseudoalteromonas sp. T1lg10]|uniref:hypothetical protein n=1 Tax=Pseudoalteromonas sp. T1lg10 TaxID=2077093 RepID=UPI000CF63229|nr:hypothetical protein [Pseudoalteromonas sp. T1lg10]
MQAVNLKRAKHYAQLQIAVAPKAIKAMAAEHNDHMNALKKYRSLRNIEPPEFTLPSHASYKQLAIIYKKEKRWDDVIALCSQAQEQGWAGDWEWRIEEAQAKLNSKT